MFTTGTHHLFFQLEVSTGYLKDVYSLHLTDFTMLKELVGWLHLEEALQGLFNLLEREKGEKKPQQTIPHSF